VWQWWQLKYSFFGILSGTCPTDDHVPMTTIYKDQDKKEEQGGMRRATHAPLTHATVDLLT
jgi:hypothetical protein